MIKRELTVADIFTYMEMDSKQIYDIVNKHYKDKPDDYKVRIADFKNDTSKFFTVLELKLAADDLHNREQSPKIVDEDSFNKFINEITVLRFIEFNTNPKRIVPKQLPTFDIFKENEICLQWCPNHVFYDPKDNTISFTVSLSKKYNDFESINWNEYRIIYDFYQNNDEDSYIVRGITKQALETAKTSQYQNKIYGVSRVL